MARTKRAGRAPSTRRALPVAAVALLECLDRGDFPAALYLEGPDEGLKAALLAELRHAWARDCPEAPTARVFISGASRTIAVLLNTSHVFPLSRDRCARRYAMTMTR